MVHGPGGGAARLPPYRIGHALGVCRAWKRRLWYLSVLNIQRFDAGCRSGLQLRSFTGNRDERSARLLAGHRLGRGTGVEGRLDQIIGLDTGRIAHGVPSHVHLYAKLGKDAVATATPIRM